MGCKRKSSVTRCDGQRRLVALWLRVMKVGGVLVVMWVNGDTENEVE